VTRLIFAVEGRTEDNFVRSSLRDHLWGFGLSASSTIVGKAKAAARGNSGRGVRGGGCYADWEKDIRNCLKDNPSPDFRLTTLFDLYGLPDDFPMRNRIASDHSQADRCDRLQQVLADKINDWRFIPYIQLHEFETSLQIEVASLPPEEINDSRDTAPSKRLLRHIPDYRKVTDGPDAIYSAGLALVRNRCPRFDAWIKQLESLSETIVSM
jgi:hypothetical protein